MLDLLITLDRGFNWFNPFHTLANIIDLYHDIIMSLSPVYDVYVYHKRIYNYIYYNLFSNVICY